MKRSGANFRTKRLIPALTFFLSLPLCMSQESRFPLEAEASLVPEGDSAIAVSAVRTGAENPSVPGKSLSAEETVLAAAEAVLDGTEGPELDMETVFRQRITESAREYLGVPYRYAAAGPEGFDCTGLVYFVYREAAGMDVSRSTTGLWNSGKKIPLSEVRPGDVLIFTTIRAGASHAGIVLENGPGGILFIHAASQGSKTGVIISNLNENYYKTRFMGARNYFPD